MDVRNGEIDHDPERVCVPPGDLVMDSENQPKALL